MVDNFAAMCYYRRNIGCDEEEICFCRTKRGGARCEPLPAGIFCSFRAGGKNSGENGPARLRICASCMAFCGLRLAICPLPFAICHLPCSVESARQRALSAAGSGFAVGISDAAGCALTRNLIGTAGNLVSKQWALRRFCFYTRIIISIQRKGQ